MSGLPPQLARLHADWPRDDGGPGEQDKSSGAE